MFGQDVIGEVALGEVEAGTLAPPPEFWWATSAEAEFEWDESSHSEVEFGP
jgi:hypothetical protein